MGYLMRFIEEFIYKVWTKLRETEKEGAVT